MSLAFDRCAYLDSSSVPFDSSNFLAASRLYCGLRRNALVLLDLICPIKVVNEIDRGLRAAPVLHVVPNHNRFLVYLDLSKMLIRL